MDSNRSGPIRLLALSVFMTLDRSLNVGLPLFPFYKFVLYISYIQRSVENINEHPFNYPKI